MEDGDKYNVKIEELKTLERGIKKDLGEFQKKVDTPDTTVALERLLEKNLKMYLSAQERMKKEYDEKSGPFFAKLPPKEYNRRVTEIRNLLITYDKMAGDFKAYQTNKYKYRSTNDPNMPYEETEAMKGMSNTELFTEQQKKIKNQNVDIEEIIGEAKIGKELANDIKVDLSNQNKLLDVVETDMDKLEGRMGRVRKKFEVYIEKSSHCCLIIIAIIEAVGMALIFILL